MVTREEVDLAKDIWQQARISLALELEAWGILQSSRQALVTSMSKVGFSYNETEKALAEMVKDHRERTALYQQHLTKAEEEYARIEKEYKAQRS